MAHRVLPRTWVRRNPEPRQQQQQTTGQRLVETPTGRMVSLSLTDADLLLLRYLTRGDANKQIARQIGKSCPTVNRHISRLMRQYDCRNRTELAVWSIVSHLPFTIEAH